MRGADKKHELKVWEMETKCKNAWFSQTNTWFDAALAGMDVICMR